MTEPLPIRYSQTGLPFVAPPVFRTPGGTPYLKEAGVTMVARPHVDLSGVQSFLDGFDESLGFSSYLDDPVELPDAERLVKFAGQLCYLSLGDQRTMNAEAKKYLDNIKASGHGSVTEHAVFVFLLWGVDRSVTHELVRHRAGFGFSQVSQRYVDGSRLRFVERPEYQVDLLPGPKADVPDAKRLRHAVAMLHADFERSVDRARADYDQRAAWLGMAREAGHPMLQGDSKTELRKQLNQAARAVLPNEAEAPIVVSANVRAWRHASEMRANSAADVQIRAAAMKVYRCIREMAPILMDDYAVVDLPASGTRAITTPHRKI